jgi:hypothetical protein
LSYDFLVSLGSFFEKNVFFTQRGFSFLTKCDIL